MKFSLIIPTYNRATLIGETIQSVIDQSYSNWECIVVDDGSTDNTEQVVNEFINRDSRISFYRRPEGRLKGANACRNFGLEKSNGAIINWLDSDDLLIVNHFQTHINEHEKSHVNCVVSRALTFGSNLEDLNDLWSEITPNEEDWKDMICGRISWATPSPTWKKNSLPIRPFNEALQDAQEWFFHVTMLLNDMSYQILNIDTIRVRRHDKRIGKSVSAQKFWSRYVSRLMIYRTLKKNRKLDSNLEFYLFKIMLNALKKSTYHLYFNNIFEMSFSLLWYGINTIYWKQIYRGVLLGVPLYSIFKKGETFFKFKNRV
ncbi:glycosyltransferase family 2 protein [Algibacter agarivorans]|uniref:Glycosyltransferase family 2 protein n=1 Tax=Algibacter agarivorans TaxID=1109741 RepID=A0ABP9GQD9_9FLAO